LVEISFILIYFSLDRAIASFINFLKITIQPSYRGDNARAEEFI